MGYTFRKQVVAIIGSTGQIGTPLTKGLLALGHDVKCFSRRSVEDDKTGKLAEYAKQGAEVIVQTNLNDKDELVANLQKQKAETLICAVPASQVIVTQSEPLWLEAAIESRCVKRFVPTEFGAHTRNIDYGDGILFDEKKRLHDKIFATNMGWTFFYNGGIMDYFIFNLRFFDKITTFGDVEAKLFTHDINDIGKCAAYALTDDRTMNKCVQMDYNIITQKDMLEKIKVYYPDYPFEYQHYSTEFITKAKDVVSEENSSKKGAETDQERWGINYVVYVAGKLGAFTDETLRATELYPDFKVSRTPDEALKDPKFVFESGDSNAPKS